MKQNPVSDTAHRLAVPPGKEILSIQLRPDGLSYAWTEQGVIQSAALTIPKGYSVSGMDDAFSRPRWPQRLFSSVQVCVPSPGALLIPEEWNRPEQYDRLLAGAGCPVPPGSQVMTASCPDHRAVLFSVCRPAVESLRKRYGQLIRFYHPLAVNLRQPKEQSTLLYIDRAGGTLTVSLSRGNELCYADVFPAEKDTEAVLIANRILETREIGACRIVVSGDGCTEMAAGLRRYYPEVILHPENENRNLFFPWTCV
ncbi:MAG: DUF3822 family protein [Rikenellaceae bacterium]|nr:DUF3822 family protein [Rikenellaceae bacterium]